MSILISFANVYTWNIRLASMILLVLCILAYFINLLGAYLRIYLFNL